MSITPLRLLASRPSRILASLLSLATAAAQNPPWEVQTFSFGWNPYNSTVTQCRVLTYSWNTNPGAAPTPQPPYSLVVWSGNQQPYAINAGQGVANSGGYEYAWVVDLPVGGPYMVTLYDSQGGTGGTANVFSILTADPASCAVTNFSPASLKFNLGNVQTQCGVIPITVSGGTAPYTLKVLPENYPPKSVSYSTGEFNYTLDVKAGVNIFFAVEDSTGKGAVAPLFNVQTGNTACQNAAQTLAPGSPGLTSVFPGLGSPSSTSGSAGSATATGANGGGVIEHKNSHVGLIAGCVAAGVVILLCAAIFVWMRYRRKKNSNPPQPGFAQNHDIDHPSIQPYVGGAAAGAGPTMANAWDQQQQHHQPQHSGIMPMPMAPTGPRTTSWHSTTDANSSALLMSRRGDVKGDPTLHLSGGYNTPMTAYNPSEPGSSPRPEVMSQYGPASEVAPQSNRYSDGQTSSVAADPYWMQQQNAMASPMRTTSPSLPPGARSPNPIMGVMRSNQTSEGLDRLHSPPPRYSER